MFGVGRRLLRGQRSMEATARRVEAEFPELGSNLINVVQLSEDRKNVDRAFCEAAIHQAAAEIGARRLRPGPRQGVALAAVPLLHADAARSGRIVRRAGRAGRGGRGLRDAGSPTGVPRRRGCWPLGSSCPRSDRSRSSSVTPGNTDVLVGESVEIAAEIKNPDGKPHRGHAAGSLPTARRSRRCSMTADEKHQRYKLTVPSVLKPFKYRLEIGDSQTQVYAVGVREKPVVETSR